MDETSARAVRTALQVDVPEADHLVAAVERARPPGAVVLRPAHVSLSYPWLPPPEAFAAQRALEVALAACAPFPLELAGLRRFPPDRRGRAVLYLEPVPAEPLRALAAAVTAPPHLAPPGPEAAFRPHLSLARSADEGDLDDLAALVEPLLPVRAVARTVQLRVQYGRWWRVERVLHLGAPPWA